MTEPVGFVSGVYETDELAVERCDDQNKCTLTFAFGRNFETDKDERSDSRKQLEDILIEAGDKSHHDAYAYIDRIEGDTHTRTISEVTTIWVRASSVEEAEEAPEAMAEWSVFATLFGCVILFKLIQYYRKYMYNLAIADLKKQ